MEEILGDLLLNFAHLADRNQIDIGPLIIDAARIYKEETDGTGTQFDWLREAALRNG